MAQAIPPLLVWPLLRAELPFHLSKVHHRIYDRSGPKTGKCGMILAPKEIIYSWSYGNEQDRYGIT